MRTRIKICGLTNLEDAIMAVNLGADALGFIFTEESPRYIKPEVAAQITSQVPPFVTKIGVFKDQTPEIVREIANFCKLHVVQLHGNETPIYCKKLGLDYIKAFRVKDENFLARIPDYTQDNNVDGRAAFLLDTFVHDKAGGTGITFDWGLALKAQHLGYIILSGGLKPDNVSQAIICVRPFAVDTSSGVEILPGKKDLHKVKAFIEEVHRTDSSP